MAKNKMTQGAKKKLVKIGRELGTLNEADIAFIMDPATTEFQCENRMIDARKRS